jgi:hypothetical protein
LEGRWSLYMVRCVWQLQSHLSLHIYVIKNPF